MNRKIVSSIGEGGTTVSSRSSDVFSSTSEFEEISLVIPRQILQDGRGWKKEDDRSIRRRNLGRIEFSLEEGRKGRRGLVSFRRFCFLILSRSNCVFNERLPDILHGFVIVLFLLAWILSRSWNGTWHNERLLLSPRSSCFLLSASFSWKRVCIPCKQWWKLKILKSEWITEIVITISAVDNLKVVVLAWCSGKSVRTCCRLIISWICRSLNC